MNLVRKLAILGIATLASVLTPNYSREEEQFSSQAPKPLTSKTYTLEDELKHVPGQLIVSFHKNPEVYGTNTKYESINDLNRQYNVQSYKPLPTFEDKHELQILKLGKDIDVLKAVEHFNNDPNVKYAEPNYIFFKSHSSHLEPFIPNDPLYRHQWQHIITEAPLGWTIERGIKDTVIAIIGSGIDYEHPDLKDNIWINPGEDINRNGIVDDSDFNGIDDDQNGFIDDIRGYDFVDVPDEIFDNPSVEIFPRESYSPDNNPMDFDGHETQVAGVAAATGNNGIGVSGVCQNCSLMPLKISSAVYVNKVQRNFILNDAMITSVYYAANNGADIINFSTSGESDILKDAINHAHGKGVILISAAGNDTTSEEFYPAAYENVLAVTSTDREDKKASFSNFGDWTDVAAPGSAVTTLINKIEYEGVSGTSISSPYVAGLAGLLKSHNPDLNPEQIKQIIKTNVDPVVSEVYIGTGRVNVSKALNGASIFNRGDLNGDGKVDLTDAMKNLNYSFNNGQRPECLDAADVNDDGNIDVSDPIYSLLYSFRGGNNPPAPFERDIDGNLIPGVDPTLDDLGCFIQQ